jgi:Protein of unknown function (DUF3293)
VAGKTDSIDEKWDAYHGTVLEFADVERGCLRVDLRHPDERALAERLATLGLRPPVAILTAENPQGANAEDAPTSRQEARQEVRNDDRHATLLAELRDAGMPFARVDGVAPDGDYRERCVAVPLGREDGRALARRLGQLAFFWFDGSRVWLEPGVADHEHEVLPAA